MPDLTGLQEAFAREYIIDHNATAALIRAGSKAKYPRAIALRMVNKSHVLARIKELEAEVREEFDIKKAELVHSWQDIEGTSIADFVEQDPDGEFRFRDLTTMPPEKVKVVESIKITSTTTRNKDGSREYTTRTTQFKLYSRTEALKELGKIHGDVYKKDNLQKGPKILAPIIRLYDGAGGKKTKSRRTVPAFERPD